MKNFPKLNVVIETMDDDLLRMKRRRMERYRRNGCNDVEKFGRLQQEISELAAAIEIRNRVYK